MAMNRKFNSILILLFVVLGACLPVNAQDETVRSRYNQMIENIVNDIVQTKNGYPELESFSQAAISQDRNGFKSIFYMHDSSGTASGGLDPYGYQFSISIKDLGSYETQDVGSSWEEKFPLLGFKVVIESQKKGDWASFDLRKIIEAHLEDLKVLEQNYLPFHLELKSDKDVYSVREDIVLTATLKNMGIQAYKLADLDDHSLYCKIGDKEWGSSEVQIELNKVLNSYGTIKKILRIYGMETPQELWIGCTYALGYKGVQPYSRIKISIQPRR